MAEKDDKTATEEVYEKAIEIASRTAIEVANEQRREMRKTERGRRLKNTRTLLKRYRWFKEFSDNAVMGIDQLLVEEDRALLESMGMESGNVERLESMENRVLFTKTVMGHVDTMLGVYRSRCEEGRDDAKRRWRVIDAMYITPEKKDVWQIAEDEGINERTVYKDIDTAVNDLAGLFFGIDLSFLL